MSPNSQIRTQQKVLLSDFLSATLCCKVLVNLLQIITSDRFILLCSDTGGNEPLLLSLGSLLLSGPTLLPPAEKQFIYFCYFANLNPMETSTRSHAPEDVVLTSAYIHTNRGGRSGCDPDCDMTIYTI